MSKISKVKIEDLVAASKKYVDAQLKAADLNKNALLSPTEAKKLATDLQDNFEASQFKTSWGSVKAADVAREFVVMMEAWAKASDSNRDGFISITETAKLPRTLRDNVTHYISAQQDKAVSSGGLTTRDLTPASRIAEHQAKFGTSPVSYAEAFKIALDAVATDPDMGLPSFVREFGGPDNYGLSDPKAIAAEVKELLAAGSMELIGVDDEIPNGEANSANWIFSVDTAGQGDHGLWAIVDRKTGSVSVDNFN